MKNKIQIIDWAGNILFEGSYKDKNVDMVLDAFKRLYKLRNVQPNYIGFKIIKSIDGFYDGREIEKVLFKSRQDLENSNYYFKTTNKETKKNG